MRVAVCAIVLLAACQSSGTPAPAASPIGVEWRLVELNGKAAGKGANGQPATLLLDTVAGRASGFAGCNRFSGHYTLTGAALTFGPLALTRMACATGDDLERSYTAALEQTTNLRVTSNGLELRADSLVVAKFAR